MNIIITHSNGDFDALAALVAASKLYPGSLVILPEPQHTNVRAFINLYRDLLPLSDPGDLNKEEIENVIVVDTNKRGRLGKWAFIIDYAMQVFLYDHHPGHPDFITELISLEEVGATTTILFEELQTRNIDLTEFEATLLLLGIYEDTGCLTYDITTSRDAETVAGLWKYDPNTRLIQEYLRSPLTNTQKELLEKLIHNSELLEINRRRVLISMTVLDEYVVGAAVLLQLLDEIEDAGLTVVIIQMTDAIYLAARSMDEDLNLLELLAPFNVKGYSSVVSAHFKGVQAEEVKKQVIEFLKYYLPPAPTAGKAASKPVFTLKSDVTLKEADDILAEHSFKGCPVVEDGKLVGIISRRDIRKGIRSDLGHAPVKGYMTNEVITGSPEQSLNEMRRLMIEENIGRIPLLDQEGNLAGIITRSDILRYLNYMDRRGRSIRARLYAEEDRKDARSDRTENDQLNNLAAILENGLQQRTKEVLREVSILASEEKIKVYLVGGIIRDLLINYPPEQDLDFVVIGDAVDFAFKLQNKLGGSIRHFAQFGTASLELNDGLRLDLVTARKEFYTSPAALPRIEKSGLKNDLFRRDFTINTMACSLEEEQYGEFIDYYNGKKDLQKGVIRVLYQHSFIDDPLRILRAVRFEQRYNFEIESKTLKLLHEAAGKNILDKVSRQRLNQELKLIYREPSPVKILKRFTDLNIINSLYPGIQIDQKTWQTLFKLEGVLSWVESRGWEENPDFEVAYLSGLLCNLESQVRSAIIKKLYLSREREDTIIKSCEEAPAVLEKLNQSDLNPSTVVNYLEPLPVEAILLVYTQTENSWVKENLKLYMDGLRYIRPRLRGGDLKELGVKPGPLYREIIDKLKQAVLDGEVRTPQEELDFVINYLEGEKKEEE
ncbi:MAG: CBS domain-containing protein [Bacillota bacterium]